MKTKNTTYYQLEEFSVIDFYGNDRVNFLQGQVTNDIKSLQIGEGCYSALLTPQAKIISIFFLYKCSDKIRIILPTDSMEHVLEHMDKHIVMDEVDAKKTSEKILLLSGNQSTHILQKISQCLLTPQKLYCHQSDDHIFAASANVVNADDVFICSVNLTPILASLENIADIHHLNSENFETLRIEAGFPMYGKDYDNTFILPETGLQTKVVSYTKGCFIGQEIVARVKSRGSVSKVLMGLIFDTAEKLSFADSAFKINGKPAGIIKSSCFSPVLNKFIALAYLYRDFRLPESILEFAIDAKKYKTFVTFLPFCQDETVIRDAQNMFDNAMEIFADSADEQNAETIILLRKAIEINPKMTDAYEALGVILSRSEKYDEAIELMKQLKTIDPSQIMAYTNLSVFYMKKNMIDEAEYEKNQGTLMSFKLAAAKRKERIDDEQIQKAKKDAIKRRMEMFEQVLKIDSADITANYGMGKALNDVYKYAEAAPFLEKTIKLKSDYSVAYLQLGLAYMNLQKTKKAVVIFTRGIEIASMNGDLMPKNEMEQHLSRLK